MAGRQGLRTFRPLRLQPFFQGGSRTPARGGLSRPCPKPRSPDLPGRIRGILRSDTSSRRRAAVQGEAGTARGRQRRVHPQRGGGPFFRGRFQRSRGGRLPPAPARQPHELDRPEEHRDPGRQPQSVVVVAPLRPAPRVVRLQTLDDLVGPLSQVRRHDVPEPLLRQPVVLQQGEHVLVQRVGLVAQRGVAGALEQHLHGLLRTLVPGLVGLLQEVPRRLPDLLYGGFDLPVLPAPRRLGQVVALPGDEAPRVPDDGEAGLEPFDALLLGFQTLHVTVQVPFEIGRQVGQGPAARVDGLYPGVHPFREIGQHVEVAVDFVPDLFNLDDPLLRQHLGRADRLHHASPLRRRHVVAPDLDVEESRRSQQAKAQQDAQSPVNPMFHGSPP